MPVKFVNETQSLCTLPITSLLPGRIYMSPAGNLFLGIETVRQYGRDHTFEAVCLKNGEVYDASNSTLLFREVDVTITYK